MHLLPITLFMFVRRLFLLSLRKS